MSGMHTNPSPSLNFVQATTETLININTRVHIGWSAQSVSEKYAQCTSCVLLVALLLQHPLHTSDLITSCYSQVSSVLVTIRSHASCTGEYQNNGVYFYLVMLYKAGKIHNCCVSCDDNSELNCLPCLGFTKQLWLPVITGDMYKHCLVELPQQHLNWTTLMM